jgi:hypothetical protein
MIAKTFEVRDRMTFIPVMAVQLEPGCERDRYLLARAGFGLYAAKQAEYVQLARIAGGGGQSYCDPYEWGDRTMQVAHSYICAHWAELESGAVVDVEFILGQSESPKRSEAEDAPL